MDSPRITYDVGEHSGTSYGGDCVSLSFYCRRKGRHIPFPAKSLSLEEKGYESLAYRKLVKRVSQLEREGELWQEKFDFYLNP